MASATSVVAPVKTGTSVRNQETSYYNTKVITLANGALQRETYRTDVKGNNGVLIQKLRVDDTGKVTLKETTTNATATEKSALQNPNSQLNQSIKSQVTDAKKKLGSDANSDGAKNETFNKLEGSGNQATKPDPAGDGQAAANEAEIKEENKEETRRERKKYDPLIVYPEKLQLQYQDCIKFSMLRYVQSGLSPGTTAESLGKFARSVIVKNGVPTVGERKPITTIVLPIPGGINDSNTVDWQGDSLDEISKAFASIAQQTITKGAPGADKSVNQTVDAAEKNIEGLKATFASKFTEAATGTSRIMQRQYGAAPNPNLELLFSGPQLRTFSFSFRLSPRSETEAKIVQKIIRYFKQGMTPKRSSGYLLLQSPHTFAISYLSTNKEHPYLNKFKECALTQCNVNYTPDGNYMSYDGAERSMTSYEITLQFQELVPLFDDDYSALDSDQDKVIGF